MPNWVYNELHLSHREDFDAIIEKFVTYCPESDTHDLDFDKVIPMPKSLHIVEGSITHHAMVYNENHEYLNDVVNKLHLNDEPMRPQWKDAFDKGCNLNPKSKEEFLMLAKVVKHNLDNYGYTSWYQWSIDNWGTKWNAVSTTIDESDLIIRWQSAWNCAEKIINEMFEQYKLKELAYFSYTEEQMTAWAGEVLYDEYGVVEEKEYDVPCEDFFKIVAKEFDPDQQSIQWDGSDFVFTDDEFDKEYDPQRVIDSLTTDLKKQFNESLQKQ